MVDVDVSAERVTELRVLKRGDHIAVEGDFRGVQYFHHGIFLGHEIGVAHFVGNDANDASIKKDDILAFIDNGKRKLIRFVYKDHECLDPEVTAKNAEDVASDPQKWEDFSYVRNNCEHFATWCKIGKPVSKQVVEKIRDLIPNLLTVASDVAKEGAAYCKNICGND